MAERGVAFSYPANRTSIDEDMSAPFQKLLHSPIKTYLGTPLYLVNLI